MNRVGYVVKFHNGLYLPGRRSRSFECSFEHARIFSRKEDAVNGAPFGRDHVDILPVNIKLAA